MRSKLSYANVVASIALFGVLAGGGAYAASKIGSNQIKKNAVRAKHIKNGEVQGPEIAGGAVRSAKLAGDVAGVALAGVTVSQSGQIFSWFNRFGGPPTIVRDPDHFGENMTAIRFPGLELDFSSDHHVTSVGGLPGVATVLDPIAWGEPTPGDIVVSTRQLDGDPFGLMFSYTVYGGTDSK